MAKKVARPVRIKHRAKDPIFEWRGKEVKIYCPYCENKHPISIQEVAACGTVLRVEAVQEIWKNTTCAVCGKADGERMIKIGDKYRHMHQCVEGKKILIIPPKPSFTARIIHKLPEWFHVFIYKRIKKVPAKFTSPDGKVGYTCDSP